MIARRADAARTVGLGLRLTGAGGGTALPGTVLDRLSPGYLERRVRAFPDGVVVVSGTNGKTTTASMLRSIVRAAGIETAGNESGSNLRRGIPSALMRGAGLGSAGRLRGGRGRAAGTDARAASQDPGPHERLSGPARPLRRDRDDRGTPGRGHARAPARSAGRGERRRPACCGTAPASTTARGSASSRSRARGVGGGRRAGGLPAVRGAARVRGTDDRPPGAGALPLVLVGVVSAGVRGAGSSSRAAWPGSAPGDPGPEDRSRPRRRAQRLQRRGRRRRRGRARHPDRVVGRARSPRSGRASAGPRSSRSTGTRGGSC